MKYNLFDILRATNDEGRINTNALIPFIEADMYLKYDEKRHEVEYFQVKPDGFGYPPLPYKIHFSDTIGPLVSTEKSFWLKREKDLSNTKLHDLLYSRISMVSTHIEFLKSKKVYAKEEEEQKEIVHNLITKLQDLVAFYEIFKRTIEKSPKRQKIEKIHLGLSVRETIFLLKIFIDEGIIELEEGEISKLQRVILRSFITKGAPTGNAKKGFETKWETYNLTDHPDLYALRKIKKKLEKIEEKIEDIENLKA